MDLRLNNKRALVMGGGAGLGRAVAVSLAAEGAHVVVADGPGCKRRLARTAAEPQSIE